MFNYIFSGLAWIDKLHNRVEGIYLLNNDYHGNEIRALFLQS